MTKRSLNINCDVGEGVGNEAEVFPLIDSCNIACGGHAGNIETMRTCLSLAKQYKVLVGAHPSYPDREHFGRVAMDISERELRESIQGQLAVLLKQCSVAGVALHHIKPHGALYNEIAKDEKKAKAFLETIIKFKDEVFVYVPYQSVIEELALSQHFKVKREAFGDRNYGSDVRLVSREQGNALITDPKQVMEHIALMHTKERVKTVDGKLIRMVADTYCIHGDTPSAIQILMYLREHFTKINL